MAQTRFVIYKNSDGSLVSAYFGDSGSPPTPGAGEAVLDAGLGDLPQLRTQKVDLTGAPTLVDKTQQEIDEFDGIDEASQKERYRELIANMEACKDKYLAEVPPWDTASLDAKIADLRAAHDALP